MGLDRCQYVHTCVYMCVCDVGDMTKPNRVVLCTIGGPQTQILLPQRAGILTLCKYAELYVWFFLFLVLVLVFGFWFLVISIQPKISCLGNGVTLSGKVQNNPPQTYPKVPLPGCSRF